MPPAPTFVKLCAEAGVTLPTVKAERTAFLVNSGVIFSDTINVRELAELVATLAWAHHSLASNDDPDSWPITLPESLLGRLLSLYPIPPQRSSPGPPASDASRMAAAIAFYAPSPPQQGPPPAAPQAPLQGQLINTARAGRGSRNPSAGQHLRRASGAATSRQAPRQTFDARGA
jgi:hypothetical protein